MIDQYDIDQFREYHGEYPASSEEVNEWLQEQSDFERDQQRENPERTPEEILEVLNKARAEMREKGL